MPEQATAVRSEHVMVDNEFARVDGVLRRASSVDAQTVLLQTHPRRDTYQSAAAWPMQALPETGIDTFAFNNRYTNSAAGIDMSTIWEPLALDVAAAVEAMRRRGYANVVLYGASAGGPTMAFYQHVAERGNGAFDPAATLSGFEGFADADGNELRLPPADAIVMQNATAGPAISFAYRLDGAIVDEDESIRDPALDMFDPANGFDPETGTASYSGEFLERYYAAQAARMNRLITVAQDRLERVRSVGRPFVDDAFMVIPGVRGYPALVDMDVAHSSRASWPVGAGADAPRRVVESNRLPVERASVTNRSRANGAAVHTLTSFLSYRAVRCHPGGYDPAGVERSALGLDDASSNTSTSVNVAGVRAPLLITQATADLEVHIPTAELIYGSAASPDKELRFIDGADHAMLDPDGRAGVGRSTHRDVVADWVCSRFGT